MKMIGKFEFPEDQSEVSGWRSHTTRTVLHRCVMVHARTRVEGTWNAYAFPVPGMNHDDEEYLWKTEGAQLPAAIARAIFPHFEGIPYAK